MDFRTVSLRANKANSTLPSQLIPNPHNTYEGHSLGSETTSPNYPGTGNGMGWTNFVECVTHSKFS